jgi:hypothetical protein
MISPHCCRCHQELKMFGALVVGPPDEAGRALQFHLCKDCWFATCQFIYLCATIVGTSSTGHEIREAIGKSTNEKGPNANQVV